MRRQHMPYRYMSQFKAVFADFEYYLSLSDKPVSVCLTERQMYILSVWNTYTPWITRWYNADDTSPQQLALIAAEIEDLLMCGCGVPEPSFTDRVTSATYITDKSTTYGDTYNTWNTAGQTVYSIAPNLDYGAGEPGDIEKLLCVAIPMFVNAIVQTALNLQNGTVDDAKDLTKGLGSAFGGLATAGGIALGIGGTAAGIVGFLGGPWLVLGLALAAVGSVIASIIIPSNTEIFTDQDAIDDVVCAMVNNTSGANMTKTAFANSLTPNEFPLDSNAAKLAAIIQTYLSDTDTYLQFMVAANSLYDAMDVAALPDCSCPADDWLVNIGLPPDSLVKVGETADTQTWELKNYYTGNYLTGGALAKDNIPFYIWDVDITGTPGTNARYVLDFGTIYAGVPIPCDESTIKIWLYEFNPGVVVTFTISRTPCSDLFECFAGLPGDYCDIVSQSASGAVFRTVPGDGAYSYGGTQTKEDGEGAPMPFELASIDITGGTAVTEFSAWYDGGGGSHEGLPMAGDTITAVKVAGLDNAVLTVSITGSVAP